jgi:hypothetical protein
MAEVDPRQYSRARGQDGRIRDHDHDGHLSPSLSRACLCLPSKYAFQFHLAFQRGARDRIGQTLHSSLVPLDTGKRT